MEREIIEMKLANYPTSKDYKYLAQLMLEYSIVCFVVNDLRRQVALTQTSKSTLDKTKGETIYQVSSQGTGWIYAWNKGDFIKQCHECDLQFIVPNE